MRSKYDFCICCLLGLIVGNTCLQIEIRNQAAGGILPNENSRGTERTKWRTRSTEGEVLVLFTKHMRYRKHGIPLSEPVTQAQLDEQRAENIRINSLIGWVSTMGLFQYLLAPLALVYSLRLLFSEKTFPRRLTMIVVLLVSVVSIYLMIYRGYYTSLGD